MARKLVVDHLSGSRAGERVELEPKDRVRFGRHPANEVAFDTHHDLDVSAWHAELRRDGDAWILVDVGSSNGTFVGGERIQKARLGAGAALEVELGAGGPRVRLAIADPSAIVVPETMHGKNAVNPFKPTAIAGRQTLWGRVVHPVLHPHTKKLVAIQISLAAATVAIVVTALVVILGERRDGSAPTGAPSLTAADVQRITEEQLAREPGARVASANDRALFLIAFTDPSGAERPLCTGFAVGGDALATNAHCVAQIDEHQAGGATVYAVRNREPAHRFAIAGKRRHPGYRGALSPDVGLVRLDAPIDARVALAPRAELHALQKGTRMYLYGFPGRVADPTKPDASVGDGMIGRVTTFAGDADRPDQAFLVQHSAETSPGSSGSPIFDARGRVIAINVGQYLELSQRVEDRAALAPGLNIAVRIDALAPLLEEWGLEPVPEGAQP
jgi:hypothetical protein